MTADTTFKEFVEENNLNFFLLDFGSPEYKKLVETFNNAKLKLQAEEDAREYERERVRLKLNKPSVAQDLDDRRSPRQKGNAPFVGPSP
jgi:predicted transposase YdaD